MCALLCDVKVNSNLGIRLKTRMSFHAPSLFLCNAKVSLNYCVGVKEKRSTNLTDIIRVKIPKLKINFRCYTNCIWEFVVNVNRNDLPSVLGIDFFFPSEN